MQRDRLNPLIALPEDEMVLDAATADEMRVEAAAPLVHARGSVFIGIDVDANGKLMVTLWRGTQRNACYVPADKATVLGRLLPQAIDEAFEIAQASSCGSDIGS